MRLAIIPLILVFQICDTRIQTASSASPNRKFDTADDAVFAKFRTLLRDREFDKAIQLSEQAASNAQEHGRIAVAAFFRYYSSTASAAAGNWSKATSLALSARTLAEAAHDRNAIASTSFVLMKSYWATGNQDLAFQAAQEMWRAADPVKPEPLYHSSYASLLAKRGDYESAFRHHSEALRLAYIFGNNEQIAIIRNQLGYFRLQLGRLQEAEEDLTEAFRLQVLAKSPFLGHTCFYLAKLRQLQGRPTEAVRFLRKTLELPPTGAVAAHWIHYRLALAQLSSGSAFAASSALQDAVKAIRTYRSFVPPGDDLQISAEGSLHEIYEAFIQNAVAVHSPPRETFEVAQENRAYSLQFRAGVAERLRERLPADYPARVAALRRAEASALRAKTGNSDQIVRLRAALATAESAAGLEATFTSTPEQRRKELAAKLAPDETLFAFHIGDKRSYRFSLRGEDLTLEPLAHKSEISPLVLRFREAVRSGSDHALELGAELYSQLFKGLKPGQDSPNWLIVPDDVLFELPFAALRNKEGFLVETRSIRLAPSAYFFGREDSVHRNGAIEFLGVGDPVTNRADPRWPGSRMWFGLSRVFASDSLELPRLINSEQEVRAAAALWPTSRVLTGTETSVDHIMKALAAGPRILHIATHVHRRSEKASPIITLGLDARGELQALTTADIAMMENAPELVTLSGCGSGRGPLAPGTGLLGLTRAFLMAGSRAVAASLWATPDDTGDLFLAYYSHFRTGSEDNPSRRAAQALRHAQIEMLHQGGFRSKPGYWAAYFLIGTV